MMNDLMMLNDHINLNDYLTDSNGIRKYKQLVCKRTLNHSVN